nr:putative manganese-dependent inorganic diphosphatase [Lachnospiraceae bacterium]MDY2956092.1 putative manganese-dependent inorganic diphosphatase [Lachnospiraceae bacterium]
MGKYSDKILVTGHKNPDTDSICSSITYTNFKNKLENTDKYAAMRLGNVSDETKFVLDYFNMPEPALIEGALEEGDKVILVDHNEKSQTVDGIENAEVLEIIDHHRLGGLVTATPLFMRVQPVGCTGTIVYQMYKENGIEISREMAGLMVSAILSDTLLFRSPTCTEADKIAGKELAAIAGIDPEVYAKEMFKAGSNLCEKSAEEIFNIDCKKFEMGEKVITVAQVSTINSDEIEDIHKKVSDFMGEGIKASGCDMAFLMITDIINESSTVVCAGEGAIDVMTDGFEVEANGDAVYLPGVVSRKKQMVPAIMGAFK